MTLSEDLIAEAAKLATASGYGWWVGVLILVVGTVLVVLVRRGVIRVRVTAPSEAPMRPGVPVTTGEGAQLVDGNGRPVTTDPENPGGGPTGGMG